MSARPSGSRLRCDALDQTERGGTRRRMIAPEIVAPSTGRAELAHERAAEDEHDAADDEKHERSEPADVRLARVLLSSLSQETFLPCPVHSLGSTG
jgi:hypothetical protein